MSLQNKFFLCLGIYVPPLIISSTIPGIFIKALGYAGGIGCALLLGMYPILMVWQGRYVLKKEDVAPQLFGGKPLLVLLGVFVLFELSIQVFGHA